MKKILLFTLSLLISVGRVYCQTPLEYSAVVKRDSVSAEKLFSQAKSWVAITYRSAEDVTHLAEDNHIIIKALFIPEDTKLNFMTYAHSNMTYTLDIEFREGRFRMLMNTIFLTSKINQQPSDIKFGILMKEDIPYSAPMHATEKQCKMIVEDVKLQANNLFESLVASISKYINNKAEDDW